jgi:hypothetical protein
MPRFHFHFRKGREVEPDPEGLQFPDLETAYLEAFQAATEIWAEMLQRREDPRDLSVDIRDSGGRVLLTLPFSEVLAATKSERPKRGMLSVRRLQDEVQRMQRLRADLLVEIANAQRVIKTSNELLGREGI